MWLRGCGVEDAGPHEAAGKVDNGLNVLLVGLYVGREETLLLWDTPLLSLTVDGRETMVTRFLIDLDKYKHVVPVWVDYCLQRVQRSLMS